MVVAVPLLEAPTMSQQSHVGVAALPLALWGQHPLLGIHQCPSQGGIAWLGLGLSQAVEPERRDSGREGTQVSANGSSRLAWNAATSRLQREASPGSSFTWHLVTVITAEL